MAEKKELSPSGVIRFGVFQVNLAARELYKHGLRVRLPGQPFCILSLLLERPGEIVTREEMRQRLWNSDTFVDFEHSLNSAVKKVRAALGDSPENSRYVETIPRVGYRFIAPIEHVSKTAPLTVDHSLVVDRSVASAVGVDQVDQRRRRILLWTCVALAAVPCTLFAWSRFRGWHPPQRQIVGKTPDALEVHKSIDPIRPALSPKSAEARDLYLKGLYYWNKRTVAGFHESVEYFQQATTTDPNYAPAFTGLANAYTLLTAYSSASATIYVPPARAAALRALELDPGLAEGHTALALIVQNHDWDWQTSEKEYQRAIELNPNYATAHQWYAEHLMWLGRFDEALSESKRARQLDPLSPIIATDYGAILYFSRQYDRAIEQFRDVLRRDPNFNRACGLLIFAYVERGMFDEALAETETRRRFYGEDAAYWSTRSYIHARADQLERARRELETLEKLSRHEQADPLTMLWAHLGIGEKEEALADLEKAYFERRAFLTSIGVEPFLDPVRGDPRFQDLLRRVGLAR